MAKTTKEDESKVSQEDFKAIYLALMNNFDKAVSLSDASDDAMSTSEIMGIIHEINPLITVNQVVKELIKDGYNFQFDLKERAFKWLIKYRSAKAF
jgi:copper(I)-binding protein